MMTLAFSAEKANMFKITDMCKHILCIDVHVMAMRFGKLRNKHKMKTL